MAKYPGDNESDGMEHLDTIGPAEIPMTLVVRNLGAATHTAEDWRIFVNLNGTETGLNFNRADSWYGMEGGWPSSYAAADAFVEALKHAFWLSKGR